MKRFVAFCCTRHEGRCGWSDCIGDFDSPEQAEAAILDSDDNEWFNIVDLHADAAATAIVKNYSLPPRLDDDL